MVVIFVLVCLKPGLSKRFLSRQYCAFFSMQFRTNLRVLSEISALKSLEEIPHLCRHTLAHLCVLEHPKLQKRRWKTPA